MLQWSSMMHFVQGFRVRISVKNREKWVAAVAIVLAIIVFAVLCATQLSRWSVWFDESFTHYLIKFNFLDIAKWTASDVHPPLFYWFLKTWGIVFGTSAVALRSMSVLFGAAVIVLAFILTRKLFGKKVGYLVLPLLVLSPMLLRYSIEMRMYTMVAAIIFAQILALLKARETGLRRWWIIYGTLVAAGMWTQYFSCFVVLAEWVWLFTVSRQRGNRGKKMWRDVFGIREKITYKNFCRQIFTPGSAGFFWSIVTELILFSPWILTMFRQMATVTATGFWVPPVSMSTIPDLISTTFFYQLSDATTSWLFVLLLVILFLSAVLLVRIFCRKSLHDNRKFRENFGLVLFAIIVPVVAMIVMSLPPLRSSFVDRYILASLIFVPILIAIVVGENLDSAKSFRTKVWPMMLYLLSICAFVCGFISLVYWGNCNKQSNTVSTVGGLMSQISAHSGTNTIPVIGDTAWSFYDADVYASAKNPVYFLDSQVDGYYFGSEKMLENSPDKITDLTGWVRENHAKKIWYISSSNGAETPPAELGISAKGWIKIREIDETAPNGWNGSAEAVLYEIH